MTPSEAIADTITRLRVLADRFPQDTMHPLVETTIGVIIGQLSNVRLAEVLKTSIGSPPVRKPCVDVVTVKRLAEALRFAEAKWGTSPGCSGKSFACTLADELERTAS